MRVLRGLWRLLVGVKDALALLFLLVFFGALFAAMSAAPNTKVAHAGALLLDLDGTIVEQPSQQSALGALTQAGPAPREYRLRDIVRSLEVAAGDAAVKAVVLDLDSFSGGDQATLAAVGRAMERVRRAGKPVLTFATGYTDDGYQLAAHASEVWLDPLGAVLLTGPGRSQLYYKGLLDKLGITPKVYRVGEFKSAVEPYTRTDMSPEARRANQAVADALWGSWRSEVGQARPKAQLAAYLAQPQAAIDAAGGDPAQAAARAGMVDRLGDRLAFGRRVAQLAGADRDKGSDGYKAIPLDRWVAAHPEKNDGDAVGVLTVAGEIVDGRAAPGTAGGETIARLLLDALEEKKLKALVVRVDSPGGSVTASERIRVAILEARRRGLPVVVSMGGVAASGGYWISTAGQRIIADPATITGSIGVFGILPTFPGALAKLGLSADGIRTTPLSGEPDLLRGTSPEFDRLIQSGINDIYRRFTGLVAQSRGLPVARVDEIGQGRIWSGGQARQLGLVDGFGGLEVAIAEAARMAKLDPRKVRPVFIEKEPSWLAKLIQGAARDGPSKALAPDAFSKTAAEPQALLAGALADARRLGSGPAIQVRCLECPLPARAEPLDTSLARLLLDRLAPR